MNYFAIQCFPDTYNLVREGPNITPHVTDLMVRAKKILGHEGRCGLLCYTQTANLNWTLDKNNDPTTKYDLSAHYHQCDFNYRFIYKK